jgi:hypothetical protein
VEEERRALRLPTGFTMFVGAIRAHVGALALTATSPGLSHRAGRVDRKIESVAHATDGGRLPPKIGSCICHQDVPHQHTTEECNSSKAKEARAAASSGGPRRSSVPARDKPRAKPKPRRGAIMPLSRAASATVADASSEFYASSTSLSEGWGENTKITQPRMCMVHSSKNIT